jgi:hypothetical protein
MAIELLSRVLDATHAAILAGRIGDLDGLTQAMTYHAEDLGMASEAQIRHIRDQAARNALCLQAAMKGIRAAQRRLAELRTARTGHTTYDQNGQRASLGSGALTLRQRI